MEIHSFERNSANIIPNILIHMLYFILEQLALVVVSCRISYLLHLPSIAEMLLHLSTISLILCLVASIVLSVNSTRTPNTQEDVPLSPNFGPMDQLDGLDPITDNLLEEFYGNVTNASKLDAGCKAREINFHLILI